MTSKHKRMGGENKIKCPYATLAGKVSSVQFGQNVVKGQLPFHTEFVERAWQLLMHNNSILAQHSPGACGFSQANAC